jgi:hypothetical protein
MTAAASPDFMGLWAEGVRSWARVVVAWIDAYDQAYAATVDDTKRVEVKVRGMLNAGRATIRKQPRASKLVATDFRHDKGAVIPARQLKLHPSTIPAETELSVVISVAVDPSWPRGAYVGNITTPDGRVLKRGASLYIGGVVGG